MNKWYAKNRCSDEEFIKVCGESPTMSQAAVKLGMHLNTFKRRAEKLGCYNPNQAGKGVSRKRTPTYELKDILRGKHPHFNTFKLKNRMLKEGIIENKCSECGIGEWQEKQLNMELDHIDGDRTNHKRNNLRMLCPNCHAQTDTYRSKNKGNTK